jgi:2-haloacid dehalogenase
VSRVLVFDVIETLLDLRPLRERFGQVFGEPDPSAEWFAGLLHGSLVVTVTDSYEDFATLAGSALDTLAWRRDHRLSEDDREAIVDTMGRLPPHPEVLAALEQLRSRGFPMATLTNSSGEVAGRQLDNAGLAGFFDHIFSVEAVRRYKPAREPYLMAADRFGVQPLDLRMIAAHDWDVWGAMRAGCGAAFVARGDRPFPFRERPDIVGLDLTTVAQRILETDEPGRRDQETRR